MGPVAYTTGSSCAPGLSMRGAWSRWLTPNGRSCVTLRALSSGGHGYTTGSSCVTLRALSSGGIGPVAYTTGSSCVTLRALSSGGFQRWRLSS